MPDAFAAAARALVRDRNLAVDAILRRASGDEAIRVIRSSPIEGGYGVNRQEQATLAAADVTSLPVPNEELVVGAEVFTIESVEADSSGSLYTLVLST